MYFFLTSFMALIKPGHDLGLSLLIIYCLVDAKSFVELNRFWINNVFIFKGVFLLVWGIMV
jgi:hypothetical protein